LLFRLRIDPPAGEAPTSEGERVSTVVVEHGHFKLTIERRSGNRLPLHDESLQGR
jgi:hypothetical protein